MVEHKAGEITLFSCGNTNRMKVKPGREFRLGGEDPKGGVDSGDLCDRVVHRTSQHVNTIRISTKQ